MGNKSLNSDNYEITIDHLNSMLDDSATSDYMTSYLNNKNTGSDVSSDIDGGKGGRVKSKKHKKHKPPKLVDHLFDSPINTQITHYLHPNTPDALTPTIKNLSKLYTPYEIVSPANLQPLFNSKPSTTPVILTNPSDPTDKRPFVYAMVPMLIPQQWAQK